MGEVDDFLAHYGVKGMKWGERNTRSTSGSRRSGIKPMTDTQKYMAKEISFGSIAPAAMIMGLGPPMSIALGISIAVLRSPPVVNAIKKTTKAQTELMKDVGSTKLAVMRESKEAQTKLKLAAAGVTGAAGLSVTALQNLN